MAAYLYTMGTWTSLALAFGTGGHSPRFVIKSAFSNINELCMSRGKVSTASCSSLKQESSPITSALVKLETSRILIKASFELFVATSKHLKLEKEN